MFSRRPGGRPDNLGCSFFRLLGFLLWCSPFLYACEFKKPAAFGFYGAGEDALIYSLSRKGVSGLFSLSRPGKWDYVFENPRNFPPDSSLELDYTFRSTEEVPPFQVMLELEGAGSWELPLDLTVIGRDDPPGRIRYALPVAPSLLTKFTITAAFRNNQVSPEKSPKPAALFELKSLRAAPRWYGFTGEAGLPGSEPVFSLTPFVYRENSGGAPVFIIDIPPAFRGGKAFELSAGELSRFSAGFSASGEAPRHFALEAGSRRFEYTGAAPFLYIPPGALAPDPYPLRFSAEGVPLFLTLTAAPDRIFPASPIPADPGIILGYPQEFWRDPRYEVFRWDGFPAILIFDTADYAVQDNLFKRLAFFVEKAGFRGRLAQDAEIAGLHGWNAHDYRGEDLAAFFEAARTARFPLLPEERELEEILLAAGIILQGENGGISSGGGAVISISRESPDYLRSRLFVHEGFHGLFFIDEEFREFSRRRWENLDPAAKRFIRSFFDYQHYDIADTYLVINEFMAHCLQQPLVQASQYFGQNLPLKLEGTWRREVLPEKDEDSGSWPDIASIFQKEAEAFSAYVNRRWGFAAGRIHRITVR